MQRDDFRVRRAQVANQVYDALKANPPKGCKDVSSPDSIGAVGLDYGEDGYILIQVEDSDA